jgi:hypothetical protein
MEIINKGLLTWEEIKNLFPDEWVVLGNPIFDGMRVLNGIVLAHHRDKRVASIEGGDKRAGFKKFTITYTGKNKSSYHIGLLRTIQKAQ